MFKTLLITTAAAFGLMSVVPATPARAQPPPSTAVENPWKAVAKGTLPLAIQAIEKFSGGRALEVRFRIRSGDIPGFDAVVAKGAVFSRVRFDIPTQHVAVIAETEVPPWMANWVLKADAASLSKARLHLADAVRTAESMTDAPAVDARIAQPLSAANQVLAYDIIVIRGGEPQRVVIDAVTGQRIADPQSLLQGWSPEEALQNSIRR